MLPATLALPFTNIGKFPIIFTFLLTASHWGRHTVLFICLRASWHFRIYQNSYSRILE